MPVTYAVKWRDGEREPVCGRLELAPDGVAFEGPHAASVGYADIASVRVARGRAERLGGLPTLIVERRDGERIHLASVAETGVVAELAEELARRLAP